jgi:hypothetical protein
MTALLGKVREGSGAVRVSMKTRAALSGYLVVHGVKAPALAG